MASHNLFNIVRDMYAANIYCAVDPHEASYSAHVVSVVGKLVAAEAVHVGVEQIQRSRQPVQEIAVDSLGTQPARERQAKVAARLAVCLCVSCVLGNVAAALGLGLHVAVMVAT